MRDTLDSNLQRTSQKTIRSYTQDEIEKVFIEIPGSKIVDYESHKFNFRPMTPNANPREGELYYDKTDKKFKFWNGTAYETIQSMI